MAGHQATWSYLQGSPRGSGLAYTHISIPKIRRMVDRIRIRGLTLDLDLDLDLELDLELDLDLDLDLDLEHSIRTPSKRP